MAMYLLALHRSVLFSLNSVRVQYNNCIYDPVNVGPCVDLVHNWDLSDLELIG